MSKISGGSPSVKSKAVYRVKNWSSYNRALIARGSLTVWLDDSLWKQCYSNPKSFKRYCILFQLGEMEVSVLSNSLDE